MDLNATRMFVAVVQGGSLSAAAARLGIPRPTLSARGAKLTDAGTRLYEHASHRKFFVNRSCVYRKLGSALRCDSGTVLSSPASTLRLCQRKRPRAVEDFCSRAEETYRVVPPLCYRQAILDLAVTPAELDGDRTIRASFRGDAVH
jgi:Bacterial regulatory helix-turn-helix protein, lysR family